MYQREEKSRKTQEAPLRLLFFKKQAISITETKKEAVE
jgi:hypothetical protein